eukprot:1165266-Pleurochrysis_carterae.AAC.1
MSSASVYARSVIAACTCVHGCAISLVCVRTLERAAQKQRFLRTLPKEVAEDDFLAVVDRAKRVLRRFRNNSRKLAPFQK